MATASDLPLGRLGGAGGFGWYLALLAAGALLAIALGFLIARYGSVDETIGSAVLLTLSAVGCAAVIIAGPVACLAALAALAVSGLDPSIASIGEVQISAGDIFWLGAAGWWILKVIDRAVRKLPPSPRVSFGQMPAIAFFLYAFVALVWLNVLDPGPLVSLLRVVHTFLIAWLAASLIETKRDLKIVLGALILGGIVGVATATFGGGNLLSARSGGALGTNQLGLVSGILLLAALFGRLPRDLRIALGAIAVLGLLLAKSVGGFIAVGIAASVGTVIAGRTSSGNWTGQVIRATAAMGVIVFALFATVQIFRPEQLPGSEGFNDRSATQRIIVAAAGIELFERHPVIGVGWRQSSAPDVIGDREIAVEVRRRFPDARNVLFPDVTPASVHNTYIQILAELGLIGFFFFATMLAVIAVRTISLLKRLGSGHELYAITFTLSLGLLLTLIWHNETPLFGGQSETVIPVLIVGMLAAVAKMTQPGGTEA